MQVSDVMTRNVCTVAPETSIGELAKMLASHNISGAPVTDPEERVVGIVTEGDILRRHEIGTDKKRRSWLERLLETPDDLAYDFVRTHARRVADVMTRDVVSVGETDALAAVAEIFEERRIKRAPVTRNDKLVGIISRADLVRALAQRVSQGAPETGGDDDAIARQFRQTLASEPWARFNFVNFSVNNGVIELWGLVATDEQREALRVAAESVPGVKGIEDHLMVRPPYIAA